MNNDRGSTIKSDVGAEPQLKELEQLLQQGDFKAADLKTAKIMLYVANPEKERWIDSDSMEKFPCTDLRTIDQLWVNNSNGRFGFSVQKRIWEENGKDWDKFFQVIGWLSGKTFTAKTSTFYIEECKGHLPFLAYVELEDMSLILSLVMEYEALGGDEWHGRNFVAMLGDFGGCGIFPRVDACNI